MKKLIMFFTITFSSMQPIILDLANIDCASCHIKGQFTPVIAGNIWSIIGDIPYDEIAIEIKNGNLASYRYGIVKNLNLNKDFSDFYEGLCPEHVSLSGNDQLDLFNLLFTKHELSFDSQVSWVPIKIQYKSEPGRSSPELIACLLY